MLKLSMLIYKELTMARGENMKQAIRKNKQEVKSCARALLYR